MRVRKLVLLALALGLSIWAGGKWADQFLMERGELSRPAMPAGSVRRIRGGWLARAVKVVPGGINSLMVGEDRWPSWRGIVFSGATGGGGVYRFNPEMISPVLTISGGMGEQINMGECNVNCLALHDLDGDGEPELLASASQVQPRGRPPLYVWSLVAEAMPLRAVARPAIRSSWSHSLGFLPRPAGGRPSVFVTFCGYGEIVEYRLEGGESADGFHRETLTWKHVGQLPHSGEWLQVADADNDGKPEICVATGFFVGGAAVQFHESPAPGAPLVLSGRIDENQRFGNVRFLVYSPRDGGRRELIAWWCTDLASGEGEIIAYELGANGIERRRVLARGSAGEIWPDDGQFVAGDIDGDHHNEVWFATHGGNLWRYDPTRSPRPEQVARFGNGLGPLAIGPNFMSPTRLDRLYMGYQRTIVALEPDLDPPPGQLAAWTRRPPLAIIP